MSGTVGSIFEGYYSCQSSLGSACGSMNGQIRTIDVSNTIHLTFGVSDVIYVTIRASDAIYVTIGVSDVIYLFIGVSDASIYYQSH